MSSEVNGLTAEQRFRQAFERLKADKPNVVSVGTQVSQNNVAKEAGCDPSALRKSRFPSLVREIQAYVEINEQERPSQRKDNIKRRAARSELVDRLKQVSAQRDFAQSQLLSTQQRVVELMSELRVAREQLESLRPSAIVLNR